MPSHIFQMRAHDLSLLKLIEDESDDEIYPELLDDFPVAAEANVDR